ncbi:hypothetical protein RHOFW104T7_07735 [Rhodanobacter thiooxydans]|uniref:DUF4440 domain-containing protein n=1 Tax=Rhodanobacter thiooxydans TaxID=416169 RepID=A0A154QKB4_9GAMM|nr:hypothetical protein [Rhodanobacter thiooxydans]EIL99812.1 hypothetical protein UUA_07829 [Rhodanobacter thiooxydans LCS2]KZC24600.1 hypothetical protein RHOFW104T7_07735 [Rhodanobacter thiooxydans]MCW0200383.1 hypothetical protein [Rhodanobacter thiooxydans]
MKKVILLIVLIAAAVWYFDISRRMTEAAVRESYQTQVEALQRFDAEPLCDSLDKGYSESVVMRGASAPAKMQDKATACAELTRTLRRFKTLSERTAGMIEPDYDYEIQSITLSPDRKQATVEISSTMRIGDMTLARSHSVEHLIRRLGRIRNTGGESTVWTYQGE